MPGREPLRGDPDREAAALLQRPVVLRPIRYPVARPGDLVPARLMDLVGHRASGERGDGPIRSTVALPKPEAVILRQRQVGCLMRLQAIRASCRVRKGRRTRAALKAALFFHGLCREGMTTSIAVTRAATISAGTSSVSDHVEAIAVRACRSPTVRGSSATAWASI